MKRGKIKRETIFKACENIAVLPLFIAAMVALRDRSIARFFIVLAIVIVGVYPARLLCSKHRRSIGALSTWAIMTILFALSIGGGRQGIPATLLPMAGGLACWVFLSIRYRQALFLRKYRYTN